MTDREKKRPTTTEEWAGYIFEYAKKWEFGTPEHSAVNDFLNLQRLYGQFEDREPIRKQQVSGESKMSKENKEMLLVQRVALLKHTIEQNESRIPGYASAYMEIDISFDNLLGAAAEEAKTKFSDSEDKQAEHVQDVYDHTLDDVQGCLWNKQDPEHFYG